MDECDCFMGFMDGWSYTGVRFTVLRYFCSGLVTVFPGTDTVESDLSIVKYFKNDFRNSLTDFYLEGILLAKQFRMLQAIDTK